jgi:hypothetical protein
LPDSRQQFLSKIFTPTSQHTLSGFDASRLTFNAHDVFIDFNGLWPGGAHSVVVAIRFADSMATVPEPGTAALLGLALFGFAASRRKSTK